jgi:hypothetical protein
MLAYGDTVDIHFFRAFYFTTTANRELLVWTDVVCYTECEVREKQKGQFTRSHLSHL